MFTEVGRALGKRDREGGIERMSKRGFVNVLRLGTERREVSLGEIVKKERGGGG